MKLPLTILAICFAFGLSCCEDVIEVDTPSEPPRLVIDGLQRIDTAQAFHTARVRVSLTNSFFGKLPATSLEQITITNIDMESSFENPNSIVLLETEPGVYERSKNTDFFTSGELVFQVDHQGQRYLGRTRFVPSVPITELKQGTETLFDNEETEIIMGFLDKAGRDDYYLIDFDQQNYLVTEDEFYQGEEFVFSYFYDDELKPGDSLLVSLMGVDKSFYDYMSQLIVQSGEDFGPFETPVATVRGNIINVTGIDNIDSFDNLDDPDNFALGYFAVVQHFTDTLVIEE